MQAIDDLLIRVRRRGSGEENGYSVEMWLEGGRRIHTEEVLQFDNDITFPQPDGANLANYGLDLFNRLFRGRLAIAFQQAWATAGSHKRILRVRLALDPAAPAIHAIPWELLHFDDSGGMSPPRPLASDGQIAFSRYIESETFNEGSPVGHRPLRLLLAISDPCDLEERWNLVAVNRATEERDFHTRFSPIVNSGQLQYDVLPVASTDALHTAIIQGSIADRQARGYDVLLFMGHAVHNQQYGSRLLLEDPTSRKARLYPTETFVRLFQQLPDHYRPTMIILVACNTATTTGNQTINSLAVRLVMSSGVPAILAMQRLVEITLARRFTYHLSEQLLREGVIDVAINSARRRVYSPDEIGWSTPTLYMRSSNGQLFSPNAQFEYVSAILVDPTYARWSGSAFIECGVLPVAPGQNWNLLRSRPEDAPASVSVIDALHQCIEQTHTRQQRRRSKKAVIKESNLIAIIGTPHSGQTTILQRITYDLALKMSRDPINPPGIMISLSGYETQRGIGRLEQHIVEQIGIHYPNLGNSLKELFRPKTVLRSDSQRLRHIFLLDNLDSLPDHARIDLAHHLVRLAEQMPDQQFIITSSQEKFPAHVLHQAHVFVIQPLSEQQILRYLRKQDSDSGYHMFSQIRDNRLLTLASEPSLLAMIYRRISNSPQARLTRNQIVQEYLDQAISAITPRYNTGDAVRESLGAFAWHTRWNHIDQLPLSDLFRIFADIRRERDYNLEDLYQALCETRILVGVGNSAVRFANPTMQAYCTALALTSRTDMSDRLSDIISLCSNPKRQVWWEEVIYALIGLISDPVPLFKHIAAAIRAGSYTHALIAARCLEALPPEQEAHLPPELHQELLDTCILGLRADREPITERREQMAIALGRLNHPQVRHELQRILVERVRQTSSGPRYEYTNVRIATARALRNIYRPDNQSRQRSTHQPRIEDLLLTSGDQDMVTATNRDAHDAMHVLGIKSIQNDKMLMYLMKIWEQGSKGRQEFRHILRNSPNPPERALAAFALGDMVNNEGCRHADARHLLRIILSPTDTADIEISTDWEDTMWAAADALTLFEPNHVTPLLAILIRRQRAIPDSAAQQLAYIAGRVRASTPEIIAWLITLLITNPNQTIKSKALQSLAWMGLDSTQQPQLLKLSDGRPGPTLKQIIQDIVAGRTIRPLQIGQFRVAQRKSDIDGAPTYLQRKAIEALSWIGDTETLADLGKYVHQWPLELREYWYQAAAMIRERVEAPRSDIPQ